MSTTIKRRISRRTAALALVAAVAGGAGIATTTGAEAASFTGEVCIFNAPTGATNQGHVGWGFKTNATTYMFGATEKGTMVGKLPAAQKGAWHAKNTKAKMLSEFKGKGHGHAAGYYKTYKCRTVPASVTNPDAAVKQMLLEEKKDYWLFGENCMNNAYRILKAYGTPDLPAPDKITRWAPNWWYGALATPPWTKKAL
jgi:hypothetical protein